MGSVGRIRLCGQATVADLGRVAFFACALALLPSCSSLNSVREAGAVDVATQPDEAAEAAPAEGEAAIASSHAGGAGADVDVAAAAPAEPSAEPAPVSAADAPASATTQPAPAAPAQEPLPSGSAEALRLPEPSMADGEFYPISAFVVTYSQPVKDAPAPAEVLEGVEVDLLLTTQGYTAPRKGEPVTRVRLAEVASASGELSHFSVSALIAINRTVVDYFNAWGLVGIRVQEDPRDIDPDTLEDLRPADDNSMRLLVDVGLIRELRTIASGSRVAQDERIGHAYHQRILDRSPIAIDDPLKRKDLDRYIDFLNRHPGRHVDVALSAAEQEGGIALDYLISENKPWLLYFQVSNTGPKSTGEWRERFGFIHNQLTGNDDVLSLQYITGNFDQVNSATGSYEAPFFGNPRLRWKIDGTWGDFTAEEVGQSAQQFTGDEWSIGGQLSYNILQYNKLFVDAFVGARWQHVSVSNKTSLFTIEGEDDFFKPRVGIQFDRRTETSSLRGSVDFEWTMSSVSGTSDEQADRDRLGRLNVDQDWHVLHWDLNHSLFLDPWINAENWSDIESDGATLAHELAFSFQGQYAFGHRLIPQDERVAGGLYTVRGYPESAVAGDTALIGRAEYRFHLPRLLGRQPEPGTFLGQPFKYAPQQPYGQADWDLIFLAFTDVGRVINSDRQSFERDNTLWSTGLGLEFVFKQSLSLRADWGIALLDIEDGAGDVLVSEGSNRFHLVLTLLY